jgi:hypothetical protein
MLRRENARFALKDAMVWTGDTLVVINAGGVTNPLDDLLAELQGLGGSNGVPGSPLSPPQFSRC